MVDLRFVAVCLLVTTCFGYPSFRDAIPNGNNVPHPCIDGALWEGVGHENKGGAGTRNTFGVDFKQNGMTWTESLCKQDSDGDGRTNGEELGDPDCTWTPGDTPTYTTGLSHPGICEPFDSVLCDGKPSFVDCEDTSLQRCKALSEPETFNYTVRFPETPVPTKETTYTCVTFEFPTDQEYHLVANDVIISNIEIMHHTLVFGCEGVTEAPGPLNEPKECGDEMDGCRSIVALWGAGGGGTCHNENMGFLIGGTKGFKYAIMQHHWNNPFLKTDQVDSSGMVFHLTPKLRPNNAGVLMIGQYNLEIPPNTLAYSTTGSCHGECSEQIMDGPIHIATSVNHMHLLGRAQFTERVRDGRSTPLAIDRNYDYNTPIQHEYSTPIKMLPGDELKTTCMFRSSRNFTTNFGEATFDEMCLAFLTYYPKENMRVGDCVAWKSISHCEMNYQTVRRGCDFDQLANMSHPETQAMHHAVSTLCSLQVCRQECMEYVMELKETPCFKGDIGSFHRGTSLGYTQGYQRMQVIEFWALLDSCDKEIALEKYRKMYDEQTNAGAILQPTHFLMTLLVLMLSIFKQY